MNIVLMSVLLVLISSYCYVESAILNKTFTCRRSGYACKTCSETMLCVHNGINFTEIQIQQCDKSATCLDGGCTAVPNPICNNNTNVEPNFICKTPGVYPDPYDCAKYYFCVKTDGENSNFKMYSEECNAGFSYNLRSTFCDIPIVDHECDDSYPLVKCQTLGKTDSLQRLPMLYYVCQYHPDYSAVLYPFIYACENGKTYDPYTYNCR